MLHSGELHSVVGRGTVHRKQHEPTDARGFRGPDEVAISLEIHRPWPIGTEPEAGHGGKDRIDPAHRLRQRLWITHVALD
jgi:hypothetical protein